jgi:polyisoprenoid-binding protein YceI
MKTHYSNIKLLAFAIIIAGITCLLIPQILKAQGNDKAYIGSDINIKVLGTSNVHDWTMSSMAATSQGDFKLNDQNQLKSLNTFSLSLDVKSLKSEHSSMDSRTYKAINADQYPKIVYKLSSAIVTTIAGNKYLIKTKGELTIAGVTQTINMDVTAVVGTNNTINCTGEEKIKLTDYKITPPSFMLGTMKVYNDLTIQFNLICKK